MKPTSPLRRPRWAWGALLLLTTGCGSSGRPADPDQARLTLRAALDAWREGVTPDDLANRTPAIHVSDVDWRGGARLERYQADDPARIDGFDLSYPVVLEMKNSQGKRFTKKAYFVVATNPRRAVVRQEN